MSDIQAPHPNMSPEEWRRAILSTVDPHPSDDEPTDQARTSKPDQ